MFWNFGIASQFIRNKDICNPDFIILTLDWGNINIMLPFQPLHSHCDGFSVSPCNLIHY